MSTPTPLSEDPIVAKLRKQQDAALRRAKKLQQRISDRENNRHYNMADRQYRTYAAGRFFLSMKKSEKLISLFRAYLISQEVPPKRIALFDDIFAQPGKEGNEND